MGDLNGAGDVGDSEYGEKADMRLRSGEGSIGDFNAIIAVGRSPRSWTLLALSADNYLVGYFLGWTLLMAECGSLGDQG